MKWISVKDRLPENDKRVLVTVKEVGYVYNEEEPYVSLDYRCLNGKWYFDFENGQVCENDKVIITAWMPLPKPYEGDV